MYKYAVVVAGLLLAVPAFAESPREQGGWELRLSSDTVNDFTPQIAYYLADNLSAVLHIAYDNIEAKIGTASDETKEFDFGVGLELNFGTSASRVVPFVGASLAYVRFEETDTTVFPTERTEISGPAFGLEGGLKFMVGERASVNVSALYSTGTFSQEFDGVAAADLELTRVGARLGYSLYF
ncbi:MAG: hypothetical protein ABIO65_07605 [Nitrospiria bacterium]